MAGRQQLSDKARRLLVARRKGLSDAAEQWRPTWAQVQKYIVPWMGRSLSSQTETEWNSGQERPWDIYNECAGDSLEILAAGLMSGLSSPSRPWKRIQVRGDPELSNWYPVRQWLDNVNSLMDAVFASSNVYLCLHTIYRELASFHTAAMGAFEDFDTVLHCRPYTCGEYWLATDGRGRVNTFWRECYMTVGEVVSEFGLDNVSEATRRFYEHGDLEQRVPVTWVVEPNDGRYDVKLPKEFAWRSLHYEWAFPASSDASKGAGPSNVLRIGGYRTMPVMTPRWDVTSNDVYGTGPCFTHLPSIRLLQEVEKTGLKALKRVVQPPLKGFGISKDEIDTSDDGFTEVDNPEAALMPLMQVNLDIQANEQRIQRLEQGIRRGMFTDLFMMISNTPVRSEKDTAAEIAAKQQEKMTVLGPMIERVHPELLDRLIRRTFNIMVDHGMIPDPPQEIQSGLLEVQYVSILAQAMKMAGLASLERFTAFVGQVGTAQPEAMDSVDVDQLINEYHAEIGAPERVLRSPEAIQALRQARAQQMQAQQAAEQAVQLTKATKQLAQSPMGAESVLDGIIATAGGAGP